MRKLCFFSLVLCASLCLVSSRSEPTSSRSIWLKQLYLQDVNGGTTCATCTVLVGLVEQLAEVYNVSIAEALDKYCGFFPSGGFQELCQSLVDLFARQIIELLDNDATPDLVCHGLNFCRNDTGQFCHLFPLPKHRSEHELHLRVLQAKKISQTTKTSIPLEEASSHLFLHLSKFCDIAIFKLICDIIERFGDDHLPIDDIDDDYFSDVQTFRGTSWRGKDCNDVDSNIYPGHYTTDDAVLDTNCNGIYGVDPDSGETYESLWCNGTGQMGAVILGDSAGAHFHIPPSWLMSKNLSVDAFKNLFFILENEFDWPMMSMTTGYKNSTWPSSITGPVDSTYLRLRDLNLCNHRDFQNIAVNGARASSMADQIVKGFSRHGMKDNPVFLTLALVGNDVCDGHPDMNHMTSPEEFYAKNLQTL